MEFLRSGQLYFMDYSTPQNRLYENDLSDLVGKMVKIKGIHQMPVGRRSFNIEGRNETWDRVSFYEHSLTNIPLLFVSFEKDPVYKTKEGAFLRKIRLLDNKNIYLLQILPYHWWNLHDYFEIITE